ncbi:hypothetical protein HYFRA_00002118 [Hymenoscyphus fraxineus]|uniref:Heme haloperoxidase family profile domain-containing protein n=1 Tax=Hymenoscyphus fraxineus TaxID=746836 RepID=A0A9N9KN23_9HELO|nr:hypothetical protein HYFRA_00002118 [Hymenoscyphus fraxineus]
MAIAVASATPWRGAGRPWVNKAAAAPAAPVTAKAGEFSPAGPNDFRGPCPMMNTLANHGFLPHDGRNITRETAIKALGQGINFDPALAGLMWDQAIFINPEPNATFFTLDMLNVHNVLEHDASLSRQDAKFGNNHVFDPMIFAQSAMYFTDKVMTPVHMANAKIQRQLTSKATNPEYRFTDHIENFSLGEIAAPFLVFGDIKARTVDRDTVISFITNEKLPDGFKPQSTPVTLQQVGDMVMACKNATNLFTKDAGAAPAPGFNTNHKRSATGFGHGMAW